jgi:RNA polymerase sigma factor (sigma-70 family)
MSDDRPSPTTVSADPPDVSDEVLLAGLVAGRLDALDTFYERYRTMAYGIARRITADDTLAEDVVQEAFLGVWRGAGNYTPGRGSVRTWLLAIVHHRAIDAVRRRRATVDLPDESEGALTPGALVSPDVWPDIAARLDEAVVADALAALPELQRSALELAYFGGLSQTEIAARIGAPLGTVKSRVRLGLASLRRELELRGMP